jgi:hypothetical protein
MGPVGSGPHLDGDFHVDTGTDRIDWLDRREGGRPLPRGGDLGALVPSRIVRNVDSGGSVVVGFDRCGHVGRDDKIIAAGGPAALTGVTDAVLR